MSTVINTVDWQPIETAPKDGTAILAFSKSYRDPFVIFWGNHAEETGFLPALPPGSVIERTWLIAGTDGCEPLYEPTHWMLPPKALNPSNP